MTKKAKIILIGLALIAGALGAIGAAVNYVEAKKINDFNKEFIESWGTYSYKDISSQPKKIKKYISEELYTELFENEMSQEIQAGRLRAKEYSIKTTLKKVIKKRKNKDTFIIEDLVTEEVKSKQENTNDERRVIVTIREKTSDELEVINIEYK